MESRRAVGGSRPATSRSFPVLRVAIALAWILAALFVASCGETEPRQGRRLVQAAPARAALLVDQGAELVEDYGSFQLLRVDAGKIDEKDPELEVRDEYTRILLNAGHLDTSLEKKEARTLTPPADGESRLYLVQFRGPVKPAWVVGLEETGIRIVTYIPFNAYLVYVDAERFESWVDWVAKREEVSWYGDFLDDYKLPAAALAVETGAWTLQLVEDPKANERSLATIAATAKSVVTIQEALGYVNVVAEMDRDAVATLVAIPELVSILPRPEPQLFDERANLISAGFAIGHVDDSGSWLDWLAAKGFTAERFAASDFGVDVTDSGVDNGTPTPNHFALYDRGDTRSFSRVVYNRLLGRAHRNSTLAGCDGHGNINAHIIGGYAQRTGSAHVDSGGYRYGLGIAPFVKLGSSVVFDPSIFTNPDYEDLISLAYRDGMRISNNSWGASTAFYDADAQRYDALVRDAQPAGAEVEAPGDQQMVIVFAAGNDGERGARSVGSPATAKNVIAVGASENVRPLGGADGCWATDQDANNAMDVADFSSRGPTFDGRIRPDILAPGTHVTGGVAQSNRQRDPATEQSQGDVLSCFTATGVCGGASGSRYVPSSSRWYTSSSGTSHAAPLVAGAAALVRQHFLNRGLPPASPAMTKAYLTNSARYMTGEGAGDSFFSNNQGMGLLDLGRAFDEIPRILVDQTEVFFASGEERSWSAVVADPSEPLRVTLAWTDAAGSTASAAWKNDLDLIVTWNGRDYLGNVFSGAWSATGGEADRKNNLESVYLPPGTAGTFTVTVRAANINSRGVPSLGSLPSQDFALVVYNGCSEQASRVDGVRASAAGDNRVLVEWEENGAAVYHVYRSDRADGPWERVASVETGSWIDEEVSGGERYFYMVRAVACLEAEDSEVAEVVATGACRLPPRFEGLTAATSGDTAVCSAVLTWEEAIPSCGGAITYSVHRSTAAGFAPSVANRIATGLTGTTFVDEGNLLSGARYHYLVRATEHAALTVEEENLVRRTVEIRGEPQGAGAWGTCSPAPIEPGEAVRLAIEEVPASLVAGEESSATLIAYDAEGLVATGFSGEVEISSSDPQAVLPDRVLFEAGRATIAFALRTSGRQTLHGSVDGLEAGTATIQVEPGPATALHFLTEPVDVRAGMTMAPAVRVGVKDAFGNLSRQTVTVYLALADAADVSLRGTLAVPAVAGVATFGNVRIEKAGTDYALVATATGLQSARSAPFTVEGGPASRFAIELPSVVRAGVPTPFSATALDAWGNVDTRYDETVEVRTSDDLATVPETLAFQAGRASGVTVIFRRVGVQQLSLVDDGLAGSVDTRVEIEEPTVAVIRPTDGDRVFGAVEIEAEAFVDPATTVAELAILVDDVPVATGTEARLTAVWDSASLKHGSVHTIAARITDGVGNVAASSPVQVTVVREPKQAEASSGCGCASASGAELGLWSFGGLFLLLRRRRAR